MKKIVVRTCKACGDKFEWEVRFRRPYDYCKKCRTGTTPDRSIAVQSMARRLPNGKYVVVKCDHAEILGNVFWKTELIKGAYEGRWYEGMMVFNVRARRIYKIQGEEDTNQIIVLVSDPPETVKKRIKSSFPK